MPNEPAWVRPADLVIHQINTANWDGTTKNESEKLISELTLKNTPTKRQDVFAALLNLQRQFIESHKKCQFIRILILVVADIVLKTTSDYDVRRSAVQAIRDAFRNLKPEAKQEAKLADDAKEARRSARLFCLFLYQSRLTSLGSRGYEIPFYIRSIYSTTSICRNKDAINYMIRGITAIPSLQWDSSDLSLPLLASKALSMPCSRVHFYLDLPELDQLPDTVWLSPAVNLSDHTDLPYRGYIPLQRVDQFINQQEVVIAESVSSKKAMLYNDPTSSITIQSQRDTQYAPLLNYGLSADSTLLYNIVQSTLELFLVSHQLIRAVPATPVCQAVMKLESTFVFWPEHNHLGVLIPVFKQQLTIKVATHEPKSKTNAVELAQQEWRSDEALVLRNRGFKIDRGNIRFLYLSYLQ